MDQEETQLLSEELLPMVRTLLPITVVQELQRMDQQHRVLMVQELLLNGMVGEHPSTMAAELRVEKKILGIQKVFYTEFSQFKFFLVANTPRDDSFGDSYDTPQTPGTPFESRQSDYAPSPQYAPQTPSYDSSSTPYSINPSPSPGPYSDTITPSPAYGASGPTPSPG